MPRCAAAALALPILLIPAQAAALPGPEVVLPLAAGIVQAFVGVAWIAGRVQRRVRRLLWRLAVLACLGVACALLVSIEIAALAIALAGALGASRWAERIVWSAVAAAALYVAPTAIGPPGPDVRPPVPRPFDGAQEPVGPFPKAGLPVLRQGPTQVVHVGEPEDYINCVVVGGTMLRYADLEDASAELRAMPGPVVLLIGPTCSPHHLDRRARERGHEHVMDFVQAFDHSRSSIVCYQPSFAAVIDKVVPRALYTTLTPGAPLKLDWAPWLRPHDLAHLAAARPEMRLVAAEDILDTPTRALAKWQGAPVGLWTADAHRLAAAARLLAGQGVEVVAITRGSELRPGHRSAMSPASMIGACLLAALLVMVVSLFGRLAALRAEARLARGRGPRWHVSARRVAAEALAWVAAGAVAWLLGQQAVPPSLSSWITPTMVGPTALRFGVACFAALVAAVWLRLATLPSWWRLGAGGLSAALLLAVVPAVTHGVGPLPLHFTVLAVALPGGWLLERIAVRLWRKHCRDNAGHTPGWALLDHVGELPAAGGKAARIGQRRAMGHPVPPGVVVWTDRRGQVGKVTLRWVGWLLGGGPYLVRSSARAEDLDHATAAGRYPSTPCQRREQLGDAVRKVVSTYLDEREPLPGVLIMPLVECTRAGVAQVPIGGTQTVLVEEGPGRDVVTTGTAARRLLWGHHSKRWLAEAEVGPELKALGALLAEEPLAAPRYLEWLARPEQLWLVQDRPAPVAVSAGAESPVATLASGCEPPADPAAPWLRRVDSDGLPEPAAARSLGLWSRCWRRDHALGDALVLLGLPRWLAPRRSVAVAWGGLWAFDAPVELLARVVHLRLTWTTGLRKRSSADIAGRLAARIATPPRGFRATVAASIGLRLLQAHLAEERGPAPPPAPSARLAAALRRCSRAEHLPSRWGHRASYDLDPACPRYGELASDSWAPPDELPPWPASDPPAVLDRRWCAVARDALRDRLAWHVAHRRADDASWVDERPDGSTPPASEVLSLLAAEAVGLAVDEPDEASSGVWVSGQGPIQGEASREARRGGADRIWVIDTPTPELAARFGDFRAVVAARGGALSHAALVARELGVPALFGVGRAAIVGAGRLELTEDGEVAWLDSPSGPRSAEGDEPE